MAKKNDKFTKNVPDWFPTDSDYELVFMEVKDPDGYLRWREVSHNLEKFSNMMLADYLLHIGLYIPDYTQFLRIINRERNLHFEYRAYGGRVRIEVTNIE